MSAAVLSPRLESINTSHTVDMEAEEEFVLKLFENDSKPASDDSSVPSLADDVIMDDMEEEVAPITLGGLVNLGNTCYLNSATQMLASLDHFVAALEAASPMSDDDCKLRLRLEFLSILGALRRGETVHPEEFKKVVDERSPLFVGYRQQDAHEFLTTLLDLLDEVYQMPDTSCTGSNDNVNCSKDDAEVTKQEDEDNSQQKETAASEPLSDQIPRALSPEASLSRLPSFCDLKVDEISMLLHGKDTKQQAESVPTTKAALRSVDDHSPQYKLVGGRAVVMADAESPLQVQDTMSSSVVTSSVQQEMPSPARIQAAPNSSPIDDYFCTEVRSRLTCDSCKYSRTQIEKYLHLSIDVGSSETTSVEEGLRKFFSPEKRELKCEKCFCESATQTTEITKLPPALLVHFKRFIVDVSPDYSSVTYRKNQSAVEFPASLSLEMDALLRDFVAEDVTVPESTMPTAPAYHIRSICHHIGPSASCGHYTADANRLYGAGERAWTRFNDANVSRLTSPNGAAQTAYMVLYELE
jgi:ubiquitin C-terminal hydrolase